MTVCFWKRKYPVKAALRNGKAVIIKNERTMKFPWHIILENGVLDASGYEIILDTEKQVSIIRSKITEVKLQDSINNGDVFGIFSKGQYGILPVNDAIVIDVGANIGDSSIYFALQGARRIIALEPFPFNYEIAKANIELNNLSKKINVLLAGCAGETCFTAVPYREDSNLNETADGTQVKVESKLSKDSELERFFKIKLFSLTDLLEENLIQRNAILKMDCEGCEYEVILSSPIDSLKRFSHILIEYHYGYRDLRKKLLSCGFRVSVTKPMYLRTHDIGKPMYAGVIFAVNNNDEVGTMENIR